MVATKSRGYKVKMTGGLSFTVVFSTIFTHKLLFNVAAKWSFIIGAAYLKGVPKTSFTCTWESLKV